MRSGAVECGFTRTEWGGIVTSPLFGPAAVQLVFVDPDADLHRTRGRVAWRSFYSWALTATVFWVLTLAPLPGGVWLRPLFAGAGAAVVYLTACLLGRLGQPLACRTVKVQLTTRRSFPGAASEVTFVVPAGMSEFASALDR